MTRYLVVQHEAEAPAGWLSERWAQQGIELDLVRSDLGEPIPEVWAHDGLVVLGGAMNANDDAHFSWLAPTRELIRATVADGIPTLGVCLGLQLMNVALGGEVILNPQGRIVGLVPLSLSAAGESDPLLAGLSGREVVHYNGDVVSRLPDGATVLATSPDGSAQAVRFGPRAWGVQFHPETTPEVFEDWMATFVLEGDEPADGPKRWLEDVDARRDAVRDTGYAVADAFTRA
ncbi:type 1 glutamine amidotransferase [Knoellia sp. S7-12]|uniref:type 1 glutamine amidotransferase n=1 Tax=Knoellia sp. S7-12 TaxID=3126698 RepID=UPI0033669EB2